MALNFALFTLYIFAFLFTLSPVGARPRAARLGNESRGALVDRTRFTTTATVTDKTGTTFIRTCTITLTPTVVNGQSKFVEVTSCTEVPVDGGRTSITTASTTSIGASIIASTLSMPATSTSPTVSSTPIRVGANSSIPVPPPSSSSPSTTPTSSEGGTTATETNTESASSATASSTESSKAPAGAVAVPGKTLSVLPIGLGVFAGVSIIALAVVGWVTYERTKYRKNFRARKQAELAMGYDAMASRI